MSGEELNDLEISLSEARSELSPIKARLILRRVTQRCADLIDEDPKIYGFALVGSGAFSELAALELSAPIRLGYRRKAIEILREAIKEHPLPILITSRANKIVDIFYDKIAREDSSRVRGLLATASATLSHAITPADSPDERAMLLTQRSTVLRCQALLSHGQDSRARSEEAVRSAKRAVEEAPQNRYARLELGQALWASARLAETDEDCFRVLQAAENALLSARGQEEPVPHLVLSRFYRHSYRPAIAVEQFREYAQREIVHRRRLLAEAFLLGESAVLLWHREYEESVIAEALTYADEILSEAIDAGYGTARNYTSLAFVQAAMGRTEAAEHTLRYLSPGSIQSWIDMVNRAELAIEDPDFSAISEAFAVGLDDASIWNALGTYSAHFLNDDLLAIRLYQIARRLEPNNAVVLTNLARVHLRQGGSENLLLAEEAIRRAASCAPRTFVWWRSIRDEIRESQAAVPRVAKYGSKVLSRLPGKKINFRDIQRRFNSLLAAVERDAIEPQKRGYIMEEIVVDLLAVTFTAGDVDAGHKIKGRQIDAAFTYHDIRHRVEVKWKKEPLDQSDLDALRSILEQAEVRGIVISMSGFTRAAVDYASRLSQERAVILVDDVDFRHVMAGRVRLEGLLEWKLMHWRRTGNSFSQIPSKHVSH